MQYEIMQKHAHDYPDMKAQDWLKFVYQSQYGCAHLLSDEEKALADLIKELDGIKHDGMRDVYTELWGGFSRLNLRAVKGKLPPELILKMMKLSVPEDDAEAEETFSRRLGLIVKSAKFGVIKYDKDEINRVFSEYKGGPVSHSAFFNAKYKPSYRVVKTEFAKAVPALILIYEALNKAGKAIIGIDGRCGSGKTYYADVISKLLDCPVIHADDYFLPKEKRTDARLNEIGGNLDYERLEDEVLSKTGAGEIIHRRYDCKTDTLGQPENIKVGDMIIVEGTYCLRESLNGYYNVRILTDTDVLTQRDRLVEREGINGFNTFMEKWIPLEETYFREYGDDFYDIILKN